METKEKIEMLKSLSSEQIDKICHLWAVNATTIDTKAGIYLMSNGTIELHYNDIDEGGIFIVSVCENGLEEKDIEDRQGLEDNYCHENIREAIEQAIELLESEIDE